MNNQRLVLDAAIENGVIRGTLAAPTHQCGDAPSCDCREFHGWLELNTALEAMLNPSCTRLPQDPCEPRG
ncbi:MAG: hypothetical protein JOY58_05215 [Solirubrobacterales bacterium]|nr:hypothetical protein [Solirubrobacterales bacterium]MBV9047643.1 hypothetical protein [Solirubrobacterales bacterium]